MVSIGIDGRAQIELLVKSAKRYFLTNHEVEFVLFTDDLTIQIDGVKLVEMQCEKDRLVMYYLYQKLLSLNHVDLSKYDYVFVNDIDMMYVKPVVDADLLTEEFCILEHFTHELVSYSIAGWSDVIQFPPDDLEHTMGCFFGGPASRVSELVELATELYSKYKDHKYAMCDFFAIWPDEVVIMKYVSNRPTLVRRISASLDINTEAFLSDIGVFANDPVKSKFKLIHNTKINIELSNRLFDSLVQ